MNLEGVHNGHPVRAVLRQPNTNDTLECSQTNPASQYALTFTAQSSYKLHRHEEGTVV
jgi:hypothetical protein